MRVTSASDKRRRGRLLWRLRQSAETDDDCVLLLVAAVPVWGPSRASAMLLAPVVIFAPTLLAMVRLRSDASSKRHSVCVIGAGVRCGAELARAGLAVTVVDKADAVGGRVRTDKHGGFQLDRGFQIFLAGYPESQACLDFDQLRLREFIPGAAVQLGDGRHMVADPLRRPRTLPSTLAFPIGSLPDKLRLVAAVLALKLRSLQSIFRDDDETSTLSMLRDSWQLSPELINTFFRPFFLGIFLAPIERQSSLLFKFVLKAFADGAAALPEDGMQAVPEQLARQLERDGDGTSSVRLSTGVERLVLAARPNERIEVHLATGGGGERCIACDSLVLATPRPEARRLLRDAGLEAATDARQATSTGGSAEDAQEDAQAEESAAWLVVGEEEEGRVALQSACVYFALDHAPPVTEPILVLNGRQPASYQANGHPATPRPVVNTLCFPSIVSPSYAPEGRHLASVGIVGAPVAEAIRTKDEAALEVAARRELAEWFGADEIASWRHLRTYVLARAQDARPPPNRGFNTPPRVAGARGVYVCGDHCGTPSLNGALRSGRKAAEALLADIGRGDEEDGT